MVLEADIDGDGQVFCKIIFWISVSYASRWQNHYLFHSFTFSGYLWGISSDDDCRVVIIDLANILSLLNLVDLLHLLLCYTTREDWTPGKLAPKLFVWRLYTTAKNINLHFVTYVLVHRDISQTKRGDCHLLGPIPITVTLERFILQVERLGWNRILWEENDQSILQKCFSIFLKLLHWNASKQKFNKKSEKSTFWTKQIFEPYL